VQRSPSKRHDAATFECSESAGNGRQTVGERVRAARKIAGLTQLQLANRAHTSLSLVKKVEQGTTPASPAFIAACARALGLRVADLTSQLYPVDNRDEHKVRSVIPALRREIAAYLLPPVSDVAPRPVCDLGEAVKRASTLRQSASLDQLGVELPPLLAELRTAAHHYEGADRERVYGPLAEAYAAAGQVTYKLGYANLSSLTTERVEWAAARSGDRLAMAAADFYRAGELIATAEWRGALAYLDTARDAIADRLRTEDEAAVPMHGVLHVKSGLAAARAGDADLSDAHLAEAQHAARHVTRGSDHYRLAFDIYSANIWAVGLAVDRRDGTEAVKRAASIEPFSPTAPRERVGHHWIDLARGLQLHGDRTVALDALYRARQIAPLQTRYHPQVRETVATLAETDRRRSDTLAGFARRVGLTAA
jgi:transcriptional regulator with XRE-family HTH domain